MSIDYWPGTTIRKSRNNAFTCTLDGEPIGYVPGGPIAPTPGKHKLHGDRAPNAFGTPGGTMFIPKADKSIPLKPDRRERRASHYKGGRK